MPQEWINALVGGLIIGVSVSLMLLTNGRVTGISGILSGALSTPNKDSSWRWSFLGGLFVGGLVMFSANPSYFENTLNNSLPVTAIAGLLVGFGTVLGSGCTSGHGVCGISRFSIRSLVATIAFMIAGILAVTVFRNIGVL